MEHDQDEIITIDELCKLLKTTRQNIYKLIKNNELPYFLLGNSYRFSKEEVLKALKAKTEMLKKTA